MKWQEVDEDQKNYKSFIDFSGVVDTIKEIETTYSKKYSGRNNLIRKNTGIVLFNDRTRVGMSQQFVANSVGVSRGHYIDIETGRSDINFVMLCSLASLFGRSVVELVTEIDKMCSFQEVKVSGAKEVREQKEQEVNKPNIESVKESVDKSSSVVFIKNVYIQVGHSKIVKLTGYRNIETNLVKWIMPSEDYLYYSKKYGKSVYFKIDRKHTGVYLTMPDRSDSIKYKIIKEDSIVENALEFR